jgi:putative tryptophan/tyrosine transport system substrate-binding protein
MRRREFIAGLVGTVATPVATWAQQRDRLRRVGVLSGIAEDDPEIQARLLAFRRELERYGWVGGRNIQIEHRFAAAGGADRAQQFAKELLALQSEVVVGDATAMAAALQRETREVPIVFLGVSDPIGSRFIESLARPGRNLTGLLNIEASIMGKWLGMLKEAAPRITRAAIIGNPGTSPYDYFLHAGEAAAPSFAIELVQSRVENATDLERAIAAVARGPSSGLVLTPDTTTAVHRDLIIALAARHGLPAVYFARYWVRAGGLMSYGNDRISDWRQVASYVDRILRGERTIDLPVQAPVRYETVLNLKTAKALGISIPETLLAIADEVIE